MNTTSLPPWIRSLSLLALLLATACSPKITVTRLKPAEVTMPSVKRVAIVEITGRDSDRVSSELTQALFDSKHFELVERQALEQVLRELGLTADALFSQGNLELGKLMPAAALVGGKVLRVDYDENLERERSTCTKVVGSGEKRKTVEYACTNYIRTGKASYEAELKVLETSTGRILATRIFRKEASERHSATDQEPERIDGNALLSGCRRDVVAQFLRMIAPYPVQESVQLAEDGKLPDLAMGNGYARHGDWQKAREYYIKAVAKADSDPALSPKVKGKAHYALGVALAFSGDYDGGLTEIEQAYALHQASAWLEMMGRVKQFKEEDRRVREQQAASVQPGQG